MPIGNSAPLPLWILVVAVTAWVAWLGFLIWMIVS